MDLEDNKSLARRMLNLWAAGNKDDPREILTDDYVNHQEPYIEDGANDLDLAAWLDILKSHHRAFPDCRVDILMQIAEGDRVASRWRFSATNTGEFRGRPPSSHPVSWTGIEIDVIEDGKIQESWVDWDMYRQLKEIGHIT